MKRFLHWLKIKFHSCTGRVLYEYRVQTNRGGAGVVSICTCNTCGKPFAVCETASSSQGVNLNVALQEALAGKVTTYERSTLTNLLRSA